MDETNVTIEWVEWFIKEWIEMQELFKQEKEKEQC